MNRISGNFQTTARPVWIVQIIFLTVCALLCLIPSVGMLWAPTTTTTENRDLAEAPQLFEDGEPNTDYLSDWGTYFEDHFAYRNDLVSVNAELRAGLLGTSTTDSVVVGTDGWLYYGGTLSDYSGYDLLNERQISNIVFNIGLMQGYTEANGASFVIGFAPNKNSLYSENMPYYYLQAEERNLTALEEAMEEAGICFSSLYDMFAAQDELLYYQRDSHWNTKGAYLAVRTLLSDAGAFTQLAAVGEPEGTVTEDYIGDLNSMLYPTTAQPESDYDYSAQLIWNYAEGEDAEDSWVVTDGDGEGTLLMFRDSFANNMLAFLADAFDTAYFSKLVPYDLTQVSALGADVVIIERAERNLSDLGENPALMPAPGVSLSGVSAAEELTGDGIDVSTDGDYTVISGVLPESCETESAEIYIGAVSSDGTVAWYVPFRISTDESDYGCKAYFTEDMLDEVQSILLSCTDEDGSVLCVGYTELTD